MKRKIGLALATGLALLIAGCASQGSSGGTSGGGPGAGAGGTVGVAPAGNTAASSTARNFNLAVKCPGVHWLKKHGKSDSEIMQQESVEQEDISACEQWVQAQPKGYVPPPPGGGTAPAKEPTAPAGGGAPAPAPASHS